jgi:hypothetical protein
MRFAGAKYFAVILRDSLTCSDATNGWCCALHRLMLHFKRLFCAITGKCPEGSVTDANPDRISSGETRRPVGKPVLGPNFQKIPCY